MNSNPLSMCSGNNNKLIKARKNIGHLILIFLIFAGTSSIQAQNAEVEKPEKTSALRPHSPKKATLYALVPGGGQIYNKKYWKLPIVYAGFGVTGYFAITYGSEYKKYREAYTCSATAAALGTECDNPLAKKYKTEDLKSIRDFYRRNMELSYIVMGAWYILQMLDATVDAHLYYWEVDENLSVRVDPMIQPLHFNSGSFSEPGPVTPNGLRITVNF